MAEPLAQLLDEGLADLVLEVVGLVVEALLGGGVAADGGDVDHAVAELDEGAALDGEVEVGDVVQDEADELLVGVLAQPLDEAVARQRRPHLVRREPVLAEAEVEHPRHRLPRQHPQLLLLLHQVRAPHEPDRHLLPQLVQRVHHFRGDALE